MGRLKNRLIAKVLTRFPALFRKAAEKAGSVEVEGIPWAPLKKPLRELKIAIVTTAGVHLKGQEPFNMLDPNGDPTFRSMPSETPMAGYMITHDYYDHTDADKDLNIVFPIERLRELKASGEIKCIAATNYGFMGHIDKEHVETLIKKTAPQVARAIAAEGVDAVLLTPG